MIKKELRISQRDVVKAKGRIKFFHGFSTGVKLYFTVFIEGKRAHSLFDMKVEHTNKGYAILHIEPNRVISVWHIVLTKEKLEG